MLNLDEGISLHALRPSSNVSHSLSGSVASPGKRHPMPMIAMGTVLGSVSCIFKSLLRIVSFQTPPNTYHILPRLLTRASVFCPWEKRMIVVKPGVAPSNHRSPWVAMVIRKIKCCDRKSRPDNLIWLFETVSLEHIGDTIRYSVCDISRMRH